MLRDQLGRFPANTRLVTITIGGNDAGFADVVGAACSVPGGVRAARRPRRAIRARRAPGRLRRVYETIRERAPRATVSRRLPAAAGRRAVVRRGRQIDERERRLLNAGGDLLARTIAAEVRRHGAFGSWTSARRSRPRRLFGRPGILAVSGISSFTRPRAATRRTPA